MAKGKVAPTRIGCFNQRRISWRRMHDDNMANANRRKALDLGPLAEALAALAPDQLLRHWQFEARQATILAEKGTPEVRMVRSTRRPLRSTGNARMPGARTPPMWHGHNERFRPRPQRTAAPWQRRLGLEVAGQTTATTSGQPDCQPDP